MIIKCPNCGSSAQVRKNEPFVDGEGNFIYSDYVCGCGCYFDPTVEEEYYLLREKKEEADRNFDLAVRNPKDYSLFQREQLRRAQEKAQLDFARHCAYIIEQLLDGYPNILKNIE